MLLNAALTQTVQMHLNQYVPWAILVLQEVLRLVTRTVTVKVSMVIAMILTATATTATRQPISVRMDVLGTPTVMATTATASTPVLLVSGV